MTQTTLAQRLREILRQWRQWQEAQERDGSHINAAIIRDCADAIEKELAL